MKIVSVTKYFRNFCSQKVNIPQINISRFLNNEEGWRKDCDDVAKCLHQFGLLIIKDPRVNSAANNQFLDLMEKYFVTRSTEFDQGIIKDHYPERDLFAGVLHQNQEKSKSFQSVKLQLKEPNQSLTPLFAQRDPKWRFYWQMGHPSNVIPQDFELFQPIMNAWGSHMKHACFTIAEMAAIAFGLERNSLKRTVQNGLLMLSPTASDLVKHKVGTVFCGFHHDFDLLTIHGQTRFLGLFAWLNNGTKFQVEVPEGHLLLQAGKQLQWYTGGYIKAGFHQVIYTEETRIAKQKALKQKKIAWRISSTMFCQCEASQVMQPLGQFSTQQTKKLYPKITAGQYLTNELYILTQMK